MHAKDCHPVEVDLQLGAKLYYGFMCLWIPLIFIIKLIFNIYINNDINR